MNRQPTINSVSLLGLACLVILLVIIQVGFTVVLR